MNTTLSSLHESGYKTMGRMLPVACVLKREQMHDNCIKKKNRVTKENMPKAKRTLIKIQNM